MSWRKRDVKKKWQLVQLVNFLNERRNSLRLKHCACIVQVFFFSSELIECAVFIYNRNKYMVAFSNTCRTEFIVKSVIVPFEWWPPVYLIVFLSVLEPKQSIIQTVNP